MSGHRVVINMQNCSENRVGQLNMSGAEYLMRGHATIMEIAPQSGLSLAKEGLDYNSVIQWNGRPKRKRNPPPLTYWDEFVATDPWYVRELTSDIPASEWDAAVVDENWEECGGESGDESESADDEASEESDDPNYSEAGSVEDAQSDAVGTTDEGDGSYTDTSTDSDDSFSDCTTTAEYSDSGGSAPFTPPTTPPRKGE